MNSDRILASVRKCSDTGCWIWLKSVNSAGYGQLSESKKYWLAHRYSYCLHFGPIPDTTLLRHTCHNPRCVNPQHLLPGTAKDNYWDSRDKYVQSDVRKRKFWSVLSVSYATCREASIKTGVSVQSIIKYTVDGLFDVEKYRAACSRSNKKPRV